MHLPQKLSVIVGHLAGSLGESRGLSLVGGVSVRVCRHKKPADCPLEACFVGGKTIIRSRTTMKKVSGLLELFFSSSRRLIGVVWHLFVGSSRNPQGRTYTVAGAMLGGISVACFETGHYWLMLVAHKWSG